MIKGGYQIIDLQNKQLTVDVGMVFEGIYDKIEGTRKAILLSGLNIGGREYHDIFVPFDVDSTNFVGTAYGHTITIQDTDVLTATVPADEPADEPADNPEVTND